MEDDDEEKTAFCTTEGLYQFKVVAFGPCSARATFQRRMDLLFTVLQWSQCLGYLNGIVVLGRSFEEHTRNLDSAFKDSENQESVLSDQSALASRSRSII